MLTLDTLSLLPNVVVQNCMRMLHSLVILVEQELRIGFKVVNSM